MAKICLRRPTLILQSNLPPSLQAMQEEPLNNGDEDIVSVIGSATRLSGRAPTPGLAIGAHGAYKEIKYSRIKKPGINKIRLAGQPI